MKAFVDPVVWVWFAIVVTSIYCLWRRHKRLGWALLVFALAGCLSEITSFSAHLLASMERPYLYDKSVPRERADAVLVLGGFGQAFPQSFTGFEFSDAGDRIFTGMTLVREGKAGVMVVSGSGTGVPPEPVEAKTASAWVDSLKVLPTPVQVLAPCRNTHDEAVAMKNLAQTNGWKNIILVTSAWHMRRAAATFRKAGLDVVPVGCDFQGHAALLRPRVSLVPRAQSLIWLKLWGEENLGYVFYRLQGQI
jgi:uncharacterized SAM-binding protein YcdF (DUF218 family)